jgi:hypothetical protein
MCRSRAGKPAPDFCRIKTFYAYFQGTNRVIAPAGFKKKMENQVCIPLEAHGI